MNKILNLINKSPLRSFGNSMEPLLYENDLVYFEKVREKQAKVNDLLLIRKRQLFIHRVIYKNDRYLITKGDNNLLSDGKIESNQISGRVTKIKRGKHFFKPKDVYLIQSSLYLKEIIKIKQLLEKNKIEYVFLKGLPLHFFIEGTHPKRLYFDCDMLVDRKQFSEVEKIFLSNGYNPLNSSLSKHQQSIKNKITENSYQKIVHGFPVNFDIHLEVVFMMTQLGQLNNLYPQKLINKLTDEFLKNKQKVAINNQEFFILNTQFLILYLALHFFHHNFQGVFRLELLDKVIGKYGLKRKDWIDLKSKIFEFSLGNFVAPVFFLLRKYFKTPIPGLINGKRIDLNIFDSEPRIVSGIKRFRNLFFFSPYSFWRKALIFFNLEVVYSFYFVLKERLFSSSKDILKNR